MDRAHVMLEILNGIEQFPEDGRNEVEELIEHDEWGIALEIICSVILEERLLLDRQVYERISGVGSEMEMDPGLWKDISALLK